MSMLKETIIKTKYSEEIKQDAIKIIEKQDKHYLKRKKKASIIASALFIASIINYQRISQKKIAKEFNINRITISRTYKEMMENLDILDNFRKREMIF